MEPTYNEQEIAEHYIGVIKQKRAQGFTDEQIAKDIGFPLETVQRVNTNDTLPENPNDDGEDISPMDGDKENEYNSNNNNSEEKLEVKEIPKNETTPGEVEGIQNTEESSSGSESNNTEERVDTPNQIHGEDTIQGSESKEDTQEIGEEQKENMDSSNSDEDKIDVKDMYTLEESIKDMLSDDWRLRLKAEYGQTKIRYEKLMSYITSIARGDEEPNESVHLLMIQADAMKTYLTAMGARMDVIAEIDRRNEEEK